VRLYSVIVGKCKQVKNNIQDEKNNVYAAISMSCLQMDDDCWRASSIVFVD